MIGSSFYAQVPPDADLSHISQNLRGLAVPVDCLIPDPSNPKKHGRRNLEVIQFCLASFEQREVLVANVRSGTPVLEAGHGRLEALKRLGWLYVAVNFVEDDETTATKYLLASNQAALVEDPDDPGLMNDDKLSAILQGLHADGEDVGGLGFDIGKLLAALPKEDDPANTAGSSESHAGDAVTMGTSVIGGSDKTSSLLKFGKRALPMTVDEAEDIERAFIDYGKREKTSYGFVRWLLKGAK